MPSSATASVHLHGLSTDLPTYNEAVKLNDVAPTAPLLEPVDQTTHSSIFGGATILQFEWTASDTGRSFLIRDTDGFLHAKGVSTSHNTIVQNANGMEMLRIIERSANVVNDCTVHTISIIHKHASIGTVNVVEKSSPSTSLQILDRSGSPIVVNSLTIGDYAIFRRNKAVTPLCNLHIPGTETFNASEFNVKILFYPQSGITDEEKLLCTAAAIAFKITMREATQKVDQAEVYCGYCAGIVCVAVFIVALLIFVAVVWQAIKIKIVD